MTRGVFITATGTGAGKTCVSRGLTRALVRAGHRVAALKPLETGCDPNPVDARALASAAGRPELATAPGFYRAKLPAAPFAATLEGEPPPPSLDDLAQAIRTAARETDFLLVEGAGGLLVPLDEKHTIADLVSRLGLPLLLVTPDALGVLSSTLTALESARARGLQVAGIVLNRTFAISDPSVRTNGSILRRLAAPTPVVEFPLTQENDDALADAAAQSGLLALLDWQNPES